MGEQDQSMEAGKELAGATTESPLTALVKVWRVTDYEWWAGESLESIRLAYQLETGIDPDDPDDGFDDPQELTPEAMDKMRFFCDEGDYFNKDETRSFREELDLEIARGQKFPCFFAGTEY